MAPGNRIAGIVRKLKAPSSLFCPSNDSVEDSGYGSDGVYNAGPAKHNAESPADNASADLLVHDLQYSYSDSDSSEDSLDDSDDDRIPLHEPLEVQNEQYEPYNAESEAQLNLLDAQGLAAYLNVAFGTPTERHEYIKKPDMHK